MKPLFEEELEEATQKLTCQQWIFETFAGQLMPFIHKIHAICGNIVFFGKMSLTCLHICWNVVLLCLLFYKQSWIYRLNDKGKAGSKADTYSSLEKVIFCDGVCGFIKRTC